MENYALPSVGEKVLVKKQGKPEFYGQLVEVNTVYIVTDGVTRHEVSESEFVIEFKRQPHAEAKI